MRKTITTAFAALALVQAHAQFTMLNPAATFSTVQDISAGKEGQTLFATDNGTLIYNAGMWQQIAAGSHTTSLTPYPSGFLFGSMGMVIGKSDYVSAATDTFPSPAFSYIAGSSISSNGDTLRVSDNNYLFVTNGAGTGYLDLNDGLSMPLGVPVGMEHIDLPGVLDLYVMATSNKTVFYDLAANGEVILDASSGLPSNKAYSHALDSATYYIGTDAGVAAAYFGDGLANVMAVYFNRANTPQLPSDTITALAAENNDIFVGTPKGLAMRTGGMWTRYTTDNSNLPDNDISALEYHHGELYGATRNGQLFKASPAAMGIGSSAPALAELRIKAFPNPAADVIRFSVAGLGEGKVEIRNAAGQQIAVLSLSGGEGMLQTSNLPAGTYLYTIYDKTNALGAGRFSVVH